MKSSLIVVILTLFTVGKLIEAGGGSDERKQQRDTCGGLVRPDESGESDESGCSECGGGNPPTVKPPTVNPPTVKPPTVNPPSVNPSTVELPTLEPVTDDVTDGVSGAPTTKKPRKSCKFTRAMWNISLTISIEMRVRLQAWIIEIESTFLLDKSLSEDQLVVLIGYSLKKFCAENEDIWDVINFEKIAGWGYCQDFVYIAYTIQLEKTSVIVELDVDGDCELFKALRNATKGNAGAESDCEDLIAELKVILSKKWSYEQKLAAFTAVFKFYFESSVELKEALEGCEIEGYGSLESFLDVCLIYERSTTIKVVIGGSTSECELLKKLVECYSNTSLSLSVRNQIKQFHDKLEKYFSTTVDIKLRLKYFSEQSFEFFALVGFNIKVVSEIELGLSWGTIYDLRFISSICSNYGCGDIEAGPGSDDGTTVSPVEPADCNTKGSLVTVQSDNTTILIQSIEKEYSTWNVTLKSSFNSYYNKIKSTCYDATLTVEEKTKACATTLLSYNKNNVYKQSVVFNITIVEWNGTVGEFVECSK